MNSLTLQAQFAMLLQVFIINGALTLPQIIILPERMYKDLTYKKKPRNKPTNMRGLVQFFVSREAQRIQITNPLVIDRVTRTLMRAAGPQEIRAYRIFTTEINLLIKSRSQLMY
jgi:hypothetical protein